MDLNRLKQLAGIQILIESKSKKESFGNVELTKFNSSEDFENAFAEVGKLIEKAQEILDSEAMKNWMRDSRENYSIDTNDYDKSLKALKEASKTLDDLYDKLSEA